MAEDTPEKDRPTEHASGDELSRRSYLKLGAGVATLAGFGGIGAVSRGSAADNDAVELGADPNGNEPINDIVQSMGAGDQLSFPPGEYLVSGHLDIDGNDWTLVGDDATLVFPDGGLRFSGDGWTFDGFEVDFSQQESFGVNVLDGAGWTFGNVVFRGTRGDTGNNTLLSPRVPSGSSALMHDVYAHLGAAEPGSASGSKLMWSGSDMAGTLTIRRLWGEHWAENTIYMSDAPGRLVFEECFFRNTNVAGVRGAKNVVVRGSTIVKDGPIPVQPTLNGSGTGGAVMRGVWVNMDRTSGGQFVIEDNDFYFTSSSDAGPMIRIDGPGESVDISNNRFHSSFECPAMVVHDGSFSLSGGGNELSGSAIVYRADSMFTRTDGEAADPTPPMPQPPEPGTTPGGSGNVSTATDGDWKSLTISGDGDANTGATFTFTVSGDLEHLTPEDPQVQSSHGVDGSTATEDVWSETEEYRFTGNVTDFQIDGPATVSLEGEQISIDNIVSTQTETQTQTATDTSTQTPTETQTQTATDTDTSTQTPTETATTTETATDTDTSTPTPTETQTQTVTDTDTSTPTETVTTTETATASSDLPNSIVVEGSGYRGGYSFTVSGELAAHESLGALEDSDGIDGSTASGQVLGGADAYRFSGELQSLELTGAASISFQDSG